MAGNKGRGRSFQAANRSLGLGPMRLAAVRGARGFALLMFPYHRDCRLKLGSFSKMLAEQVGSLDRTSVGGTMASIASLSIS